MQKLLLELWYTINVLESIHKMTLILFKCHDLIMQCDEVVFHYIFAIFDDCLVNFFFH